MGKESNAHCSVIIVTHNSQQHISKCIEALEKQTRVPDWIGIIDSGSTCTEYLSQYANQSNIFLHLSEENLGFCCGNNRGMAHLPDTDYVLFLNPDAFLTPTFLEHALAYMELPTSHQVGALTGVLLGYKIQQDQPTGKIDSTGIFQSWYGRWYDRYQGEEATQYKLVSESVPAICGALMFCRKTALDSVLLSPHEVMDSTFYMYKEDIDLSMRLRQKGWQLMFLPDLIAYHCRGWQTDRSRVPKELRRLSARNELRLHARLYSPYVFYSLIKYGYVQLFEK